MSALKTLVLLALIGLAVAYLRRQPVTVAAEPEPEYPEIVEDLYLIGLMTPDGFIEVEGRFPFIGSAWGDITVGNDD